VTDRRHVRWARVPPVLLAAVAAAPLLGLLGTLATIPAVVLAGALVPGLAWAAALHRAGPAEPRAAGPGVLAFAWGAVVATWAAGWANDALGARAGEAAGLVPVVAAPLVEELAKATALGAVLLAWPGALRGARAGAVAGALAGAGFAMVENVGYLLLAAVAGGPAGLVRAVWVRPVAAGLVHPAFTALVGAAVGRARRDGRWVRLAVALAAAAALHAAWNAVGSTAITTVLCNAPPGSVRCADAPSPADLLLAVPLVTLAFLAPAALALAALAGAPLRGGGRPPRARELG